MNLGRIRAADQLSALLACISFILFLFLGAGCGGGASKGSRDPEANHLDKVGSLLSEYRSEHKGTAPAKMDDFKKWAIDNGKAQDSDFVSTRDKESYVLQPIGSGGANVMVREATGKNGSKYVIISNSQGTAPAEEMSETRLSYSFGGAPPMGGPQGGFPMGKPK